ncbi:Nitrite transporter from formate/nitrite family [Vibrio chagasii]|nr:Nitrite transporter from formate/nitrite family [Vibrio chagasii]CAH6853315.1 Nitrite transporter from formate/nitrite family [Vibrio chagasii]CAH7012339.1 Nitrite transporter from formate/nitrite family [Vibrio chagasii]CAH7041705.1 Nitrite transporter from formate/nitrite family [Vibrio chagasii]CAH7106492.1 Nitrite transporter from formate/nitrite family [Vibrio chagasii]
MSPDYKPAEFVQTMIDVGEAKTKTSTRDLLIRSTMAGIILSLAVVVAITAMVQTGIGLVGALVFPVGFVILSVMGYDLVTGVFGLAPLAKLDNRPGITWGRILRCWGIVGLGNLIGSLIVAFLVAVSLTGNFSLEPNAVAQKFIAVSTGRSLGFENMGMDGWITCFVRGIFCNLMVCLGVIGNMTARTVSGRVAMMWFPIFIFFALVFEHTVVNMFLFPLGMILGADFGIATWLNFNLIPTILGNIVGGLLMTCVPLYLTHAKTAPSLGAK